LIKQVLDRCDYYLLVIGGRYGSVDRYGKSITEKEYDYAVSKKLPVIALLRDHPERLPRHRTDGNRTAAKKLIAFRAKVENAHTCSYWKSIDHLAKQTSIAISNQIQSSPATGWIRSDQIPTANAVIWEDSSLFELPNTQIPIHTEQLLNCEVEVEFRMEADGGNSMNWFGIRLRGVSDYIYAGYLVYLRSNGNLDVVSVNKQSILNREAPAVDPKVDFVRLRVSLIADRLRVWVNGKLKIDRHNRLVSAEGKIYLFAFGSRVAIRRWSIQRK
jgi:hypothetical protein